MANVSPDERMLAKAPLAVVLGSSLAQELASDAVLACCLALDWVSDVVSARSLSALAWVSGAGLARMMLVPAMQSDRPLVLGSAMDAALVPPAKALETEAPQIRKAPLVRFGTRCGRTSDKRGIPGPDGRP